MAGPDDVFGGNYFCFVFSHIVSWVGVSITEIFSPYFDVPQYFLTLIQGSGWGEGGGAWGEEG